MSDAPSAVGARTLLDDVMATHAARGQRLQQWLRLAVVAFVWTALLVSPPDENAGWCYALALAYPVLWAAAAAALARSTPATRDQLQWVPLAIDIVILGAVTVVAGDSADVSWTAYIVVGGFYLLPVLAATQLRPTVAAALAVPIVGVYLFSSISTREANDEPWRSLLVRTGVLVLVCAGSVALSRVQRSRVLEIGGLASERARLLVELAAIEGRERRQLSEALHDGALQYVLAARMDLEDVRDGDAVAIDRVDHALTTSATLLRSTVRDLHPAVLDQGGLVSAVEDLAAGMRQRGLAVEVRASGPPTGPAGAAQRFVYAAVRELLGNVVKHAGATSVLVEIGQADSRLTAVVTDDGSGMEPDVIARRLAEGHIGLTSHRLRVEASGGRLTGSAASPHGTRMEVVVPVAP